MQRQPLLSSASAFNLQHATAADKTLQCLRLQPVVLDHVQHSLVYMQSCVQYINQQIKYRVCIQPAARKAAASLTCTRLRVLSERVQRSFADMPSSASNQRFCEKRCTATSASSSCNRSYLPLCARTRCTSCPVFKFQHDSQPCASPHKQHAPSPVTASAVRGTGAAGAAAAAVSGLPGLEPGPSGRRSCMTQSPMSMSHTWLQLREQTRTKAGERARYAC
jgi:hypothetical protein